MARAARCVTLHGYPQSLFRTGQQLYRLPDVPETGLQHAPRTVRTLLVRTLSDMGRTDCHDDMARECKCKSAHSYVCVITHRQPLQLHLADQRNACSTTRDKKPSTADAKRAAHRLRQRPVEEGGAVLAHADGKAVHAPVAALEVLREPAEELVQALEQHGNGLLRQGGRIWAHPAERTQASKPVLPARLCHIFVKGASGL